MKQLVIAFVLVFPLQALAQAQDLSRAESRDGTIEQLVETALDRSPQIRAARTAVTVAGGQLTQAGLRPNPTLSASQSRCAI